LLGFIEWIETAMSWLSIYRWISNWWYTLDFTYQIYLFIGISATFILFIQFLLSLIGIGDIDALDAADAMDAADAADAGDAGDSGGTGFFTFRTITGFFGGLGWGGVVAMDMGLSSPQSVIVSVPMGTIFLIITYGLLYFLHSFRASGTLNYKNAVGKIAEVYTPIPANRDGSGKVKVKIQGRLKTIDAYNGSSEGLESHARVEVIGQIDANTVLVEPFSGSDGSET
jgi:hypothetical protein